MKLSTDREILEMLFKTYASDFEVAQNAPNKDGSRIYVPIDVEHVAKLLDNNPQVLFGRLYYHLDAKYRYLQAGGATVHLFALQLDNTRHCLNYPYLCALLADFRERHEEGKKTFWLSVIALVLSLGAIVAQLAS